MFIKDYDVVDKETFTQKLNGIGVVALPFTAGDPPSVSFIKDGIVVGYYMCNEIFDGTPNKYYLKGDC